MLQFYDMSYDVYPRFVDIEIIRHSSVFHKYFSIYETSVNSCTSRLPSALVGFKRFIVYEIPKISIGDAIPKFIV